MFVARSKHICPEKMVVPATPSISIKPSLADQLEQAAKDVEKQMDNDKKFPALEDQLKVGGVGKIISFFMLPTSKESKR